MNSRRHELPDGQRHPADVAREKLRGGGYPRLVNIILHGAGHPILPVEPWPSAQAAAYYHHHMPYALPCASWLAGELLELTRTSYSTITDIHDLFTWLDDPEASIAYLADLPEATRAAPTYQLIADTALHLFSMYRLTTALFSFCNLPIGLPPRSLRPLYSELLHLSQKGIFPLSREFLDYTGVPYTITGATGALRRSRLHSSQWRKEKEKKGDRKRTTRLRTKRKKQPCRRTKRYKRKRPNKLWRRNEKISNLHYGKKKPPP